MGYRDITAKGVRAAIAEFDRVGREAFLKKYGFRRARGYLLMHGDSLYDSKAIVGAAHGYDFGKALHFDDFGGGDRTVRPVLEHLGFQVATLAGTNPDWHRDELIVGLDFYMLHRLKIPGKTTATIGMLSSQIRLVAGALGLAGTSTFRNRNGVYMKLMNFRHVDPTYSKAGGVGLRSGNRDEAAVWVEYADDLARLRDTASMIVQAAGRVRAEELSGDDPDIAIATEGGVVTRLHVMRERNRAIVARKKAAALKSFGRLSCECCDFDFVDRYGPHGHGFLECHHIRPLRDLAGPRRTTMADLALLCANCHRMIHARAPWLSVADLRTLLRNPPSVATRS